MSRDYRNLRGWAQWLIDRRLGVLLYLLLPSSFLLSFAMLAYEAAIEAWACTVSMATQIRSAIKGRPS